MAADELVTAFFYGLFMDTDALKDGGYEPIDPRVGSLPGWRLVIGERANLVPDPTATAWGIVLELTSGACERLYSAPGVSDYRPVTVSLSTPDGTALSAVCYVLPPRTAEGETNHEYASRLRSLCSTLGFPTSYLDALPE